MHRSMGWIMTPNGRDTTGRVEDVVVERHGECVKAGVNGKLGRSNGELLRRTLNFIVRATLHPSYQ